MPTHGPVLRTYQSVREVPERFRPCYAFRTPGAILVATHPGTPRVEVAQWLVDNLTPEEMDAYRARVGIGPIGTPAPEWMTRGVVWEGPIELRLPTERPLELPAWPSEEVAG